MNALFTRAPQHSAAASTPPTPSIVSFDTTAYRRVGPLDRASLRIGLWLLTRHAARARALDERLVDMHRARQAEAQRLERERAWQKAAAFSRLPF